MLCCLEKNAWSPAKPHRYYSTHIGKVLNIKFKIVGKLGFGTLSTGGMAMQEFEVYRNDPELLWVFLKLSTTDLKADSKTALFWWSAPKTALMCSQSISGWVELPYKELPDDALFGR